jgi:hypothetical protein
LGEPQAHGFLCRKTDPQGLKPKLFTNLCGTAKAVPCYKAKDPAFFIPLGGLQAHDSSLEKHIRQGLKPRVCSEFGGTAEGRALLQSPGRWRFSFPWVGRKTHDSSLEKHIRESRANRGSLHSASLRLG